MALYLKTELTLRLSKFAYLPDAHRIFKAARTSTLLLFVHSSIAIILMGKRELVALLNLSSWCFVMVGRLFLAVPRGCLQFVIVVYPDHTHLLFLLKASHAVPSVPLFYT